MADYLTANRKKIVFISGPPSHGFAAHEHYAGSLLLAKELTENVPQVEAVVYKWKWPEDPHAFDNAAAIVIYFLVEGIRYLRPNLLVTNPVAASSESQTGGFLDPLLGTVIVGTMAMAIAVPAGVGIAVWLSEFVGVSDCVPSQKTPVKPDPKFEASTETR